MRPTIATIGGQSFKDAFAAATEWLEKGAGDIDALNVFPVPDGDCGTNMLLTMRSGLDEANKVKDGAISAVVEAIARGTLLGARGNSGVILSQIWQGIAQSFGDKEIIDGKGLAEALLFASEKAYRALSKPVEGTILTVMREAAEAASEKAKSDEADIIAILEAAVDAAREALANTPNLLPVLKESGVVDAGGQGLLTLIEGASCYLKGQGEEMKLRRPQIIVAEIPAAKFAGVRKEPETPWGYSTEFLLQGEGLDPDKIRDHVDDLGRNVVVVGNESNVRIHIHTLDPGPVFSYGISLGTLHQVTIRNLDEQYQDFLKLQKDRLPALDMAIVAVVSGEGLAEVFRSLGTTVIVPGGQTMNPSARDLLQAVEIAPAEKAIILPDNKNIVPTANQVPSLTKKQVAVVPAETFPQGIAALLALSYQADFDSNARLMTEAVSKVKTIEITRAVRSGKFGEIDVKENEYIAFLEGDLVAASSVLKDALDKALAMTDMNRVEIITLYYGADTQAGEAEEVAEKLRQNYSNVQVEVVGGGQPHYQYIVSIE